MTRDETTNDEETEISLEFPGAKIKLDKSGKEDHVITPKYFVDPLKPTYRWFPINKIEGHQNTPTGVIVTAPKREFTKKNIKPEDFPVKTRGDHSAHHIPEFSRTLIEFVMEVYDAHKESPIPGVIFEKFNKPTSYWVRSSRRDKVYPTSHLKGYLIDEEGSVGGWGMWGPAALLHNSGFVIVDKDNIPMRPGSADPDDAPDSPNHGHLLRGADRVRLCALNYFVEPARERGEKTVTIQAKDLGKILFPKDQYPNICQSLEGNKFHEIANVTLRKIITEEGVKEHSSTNKYEFELNHTSRNSTREDNSPMTNARTRNQTPITATNLILHGPPGTGKTYETAWEAVRLCLGEEAAEKLRPANKRSKLMEEYRRLANIGRIEFVTFHQSMSYEEFVEGLRPSTDGVDGAGFKLISGNGIFKEICDRAASHFLTQSHVSPEDIRIDEISEAYKMSLGNTHLSKHDDLFEDCIKGNKILSGFDPIFDFSDSIFDDPKQINDLILNREPAEKPDVSIQHINMFRNTIKDNSIILVSRGNTKLRAVGIVTGKYFFEDRPDGFIHGRPVKWIWSSESEEKDIDVGVFYPKQFSRRTLHPLRNPVYWDALLNEIAIRAGSTTRNENNSIPHVLIIDEINRANISKVFGELITLLEADKRLGMSNEIRLTLPYSKERFGVPPNLHVIGTMNTADRSIALLDTALRRRFTFREMMPDPSKLKIVDGIDLPKMLDTINRRIEYLFDRERQIGHSYFIGCNTRSNVDNAMRHKVIPLLAEYFYEDWSKVAAVLGDGKNGTSRFLESEALRAPPGLDGNEESDTKSRWTVKEDFDYSEFES